VGAKSFDVFKAETFCAMDGVGEQSRDRDVPRRGVQYGIT
jgi:hypothetical protein